MRFERAVSLDSPSGLGLGLFIAKKIISEHGGNLSMKSELGKGSEFIIEMPILFSPPPTRHIG
jgi:signal transduction histidine kinase